MGYRHIILPGIFTRSLQHFFSAMLIISFMLLAGTVYGAESNTIFPEVSVADANHHATTITPRKQQIQTLNSQELQTIAEEKAVTKPLAVVVKYIKEAVLFESDKDKGRYITRKGERLIGGNELRTGKASKVYIKMTDGTKILLRENTNLHMKDYNEVNVKQGKALFSVSKRKQGQDVFRVATRVAMLGIRGTQFLVESTENNENIPEYKVYLKKGAIVASPLEKTFKYYHMKEMDEFSEYKKTLKAEFEEYRKQQQEEFVEYVSEISMQENTAVSIQGNEVREISIPDDVLLWFDELQDETIGW